VCHNNIGAIKNVGRISKVSNAHDFRCVPIDPHEISWLKVRRRGNTRDHFVTEPAVQASGPKANIRYSCVDGEELADVGAPRRSARAV